MGIRIKQIHIKPGTILLEGVKADAEAFGVPDEDIDERGLIWCRTIYVGFNYEKQWLYVYLDEYWPDSNIHQIIPTLPNDLKTHYPNWPTELDAIDPEEGLIGYDFKPNGIIESEYVGEIYFKKAS